jgi:hypothetical protein
MSRAQVRLNGQLAAARTFLKNPLNLDGHPASSLMCSEEKRHQSAGRRCDNHEAMMFDFGISRDGQRFTGELARQPRTLPRYPLRC